MATPKIKLPYEHLPTVKPDVSAIMAAMNDIRYGHSIDELADIVHQNAVDHGFHNMSQSEGDFLAHQCCNSHDEISELHLAWRSGMLHQPCDKAEKMEKMGLPALTNAEEEYADTIIRALDQCRRLKIDIARAIAVKHLFNKTREYMHGRLS